MKEDFISVIVPCRNEKNYVKHFLDSVILQDWPKNQLEFLIADGMSEDGTRELIEEYQKTYPFIRLLDNREKYTPLALNTAIKASKGNIIIRMDSHAKYENDYIAKCVKYLHEYGADNVGGTMKTIPANDTLEAKSIALCMSHGFGVGNSQFRRSGSQENQKPREVDTVFGGCFKREVFDRVGLFNEKLRRSQDIDFNIRLKKAGGKIMLVPDIVSYYYPKATFKEFFKHNLLDGQGTILPLRFTGKPFKLRHYIPGFAVFLFCALSIYSFWSPLSLIVLLGLIGLYVIFACFVAIGIASRERDVRLFFIMPLVFASRHIAYGIGSLVGLIRVLV